MSQQNPTTVRVKFNDLAEFLEEVRKDRDRIDRGILRLTVRRRYAQPFVHVAVVATAVVGSTVVHLEHRIGEAFFGDEKADGLSARTQAALDNLTEAGKALGLEVRAGVFE
jgi:hypothetical protein